MGYLGNIIVSKTLLQVHSTEESLVKALRKGSEGALREVYRQHYPMVQRMVVANSGSEQEAKDVYQETIIHFFERLQQADFVLTCKIKTYLYAVSRRLWLKRLWERKRFHGNIEETETFLTVEEEVEDISRKEEQFESLHAAIDQLGEPCRTLLLDFYLGDLSMDQIREKFGYTNADNAKNQKYKCLQRLKKIFFGDVKLKQ